jgi:hypothetical protein
MVFHPCDDWHECDYSVSAKTSIIGSVHGNGALTGFGWCGGAVTATLTAAWLGSGPPASVTSLVPSVSVPTTTISKYRNYTIRGQNYTGYTYSDNKIDTGDAVALNAMNMSATNPGRIIIANSTLKLKKNANLIGTLVVNGDLEIDEPAGGTRTMQSLSQFPALVVTGDIKFKQDNNTLVVDGPVICDGKIDGNGKSNVVVTIRGTGIFKTGPSLGGSGGSVTVTYDTNRAYMWDFDNPPATKPITVLGWKED